MPEAKGELEELDTDTRLLDTRLCDMRRKTSLRGGTTKQSRETYYWIASCFAVRNDEMV